MVQVYFAKLTLLSFDLLFFLALVGCKHRDEVSVDEDVFSLNPHKGPAFYLCRLRLLLLHLSSDETVEH